VGHEVDIGVDKVLGGGVGHMDGLRDDLDKNDLSISG
jgi:hypothetical protein